MLSTTRIFPKTPRLKNHRPKFSGIFIHTDPSSPPIRWFHREMKASDSRCVETNAQGARGAGQDGKTRRQKLAQPPTTLSPLSPRGRGAGGGVMSTLGCFSSGFCCARKGQLALARQRDPKMFGTPSLDLSSRAMCKGGLKGFGCRFGQQRSEGQEQAGKATSCLLFFQLFKSTEARFEDFCAPGESFARPRLSGLLCHERRQLSHQALAAGVLQGRHFLVQRFCCAAVYSLSIHERHSHVCHQLPLQPFGDLGS